MWKVVQQNLGLGVITTNAYHICHIFLSRKLENKNQANILHILFTVFNQEKKTGGRCLPFAIFLATYTKIYLQIALLGITLVLSDTVWQIWNEKPIQLITPRSIGSPHLLNHQNKTAVGKYGVLCLLNKL